MTLTRQQVWRVLQEHRGRTNVIETGRPWNEAQSILAEALGQKDSLEMSEVAEALGVSETEAQGYLANVLGRQEMGESRLTGLRAIQILVIGILLSYAIFVGLMLSTPKKIEGEGTPLMEGKPKTNNMMN